jgi:dienelactone hydrolase
MNRFAFPVSSVRSAVRLHVCLGLGLLLAAIARAESPRVLPPGQLPEDRRRGDHKDLNGYFPFTPCPTKEAWAARSERLRRQLLVANGLWPMPTKTPDRAAVHGRIERDGYTVEKVILESFPGHFVTGSLYRPTGRSGRLPGVLCPHGHWANGRFYDAGPEAIRTSIVEGAERFERSGRYPLQARCVTLARMGCVVFHYDMVGYADSVQLAHGPGYRPAMSTPENWGYFSPQAEAHAQNMMGLQTYNSIRALDWLSGLADVDPQRIAVTGASGGGTQTFILCALDPRPAVAFPAVMVGTAMQGGCTCENACLLRVGTGNVEISALIAPRALGMTAADDWTKEIMTKGLPELKQHYRLFGGEDRVMAKALLHFPHNYNYVSRAVMYLWLNKQLKLGHKEPIVEEDFKPLSIVEMSVWDEKHPKPRGGEQYERGLLKWITEDSRRQMAALVPGDAAALERYRKVVGGALDAMIGRGLPPAGTVQPAAKQAVDLGYCRMTRMLLRYAAEREELPAVRLEPSKEIKKIVIWLDGRGKQALFDDAGSPKPEIRRLLADGAAVIGVDLFGQGEFTPDGKPPAKARLLKANHWDRYLGYTLGYNPPLFAQRVHDVLSVIAYARASRPASAKIVLVGVEGAGPWAAAARAQAGAAVDEAILDTGGFRFAGITALDDPELLPGGAKYLDLPGILALCAPHKLVLCGEGEKAPPVVAAAYKAAGRPENLSVHGGKLLGLGSNPPEARAADGQRGLAAARNAL